MIICISSLMVGTRKGGRGETRGRNEKLQIHGFRLDEFLDIQFFVLIFLRDWKNSWLQAIGDLGVLFRASGDPPDRGLARPYLEAHDR